MASKVDMSLDDIIKTKISSRGTRRGRGRGGMRGSGRGGRARGRGQRGRGGIRSASAFRSPRLTRPMEKANIVPFYRRGSEKEGNSNINGRWSHDMYYGGASAVRAASSGPTKLNITNLDYGVSDSDIKELFSEFGNMKSASVHYDRTGRSLGTAHVIFERRADALKAIKQYNGVHLDGRPMNIEIDGGSGGRGSTLNGTRGGARNIKRLQGGPRPIGIGGGRGRSPRGRGLRGARGRGARLRGGGGGGGGGVGVGVGRGGSKKKVPTAEELDAELDAYTFQANK